MPPSIVGASFSHIHLLHLNFSIKDALIEYKKLGFKWIRLGIYWSEVEKKKGVYDFTQMDALLLLCQKLEIQIVMTVGMKAPRHPEYYFPGWLLKTTELPKSMEIKLGDKEICSPLFLYISVAVNHFKPHQSIQYWQVENEPLDPSGPFDLRISLPLLREEISLVRQLDHSRPIVVNLWGNELTYRNYYPAVIGMADIIGLDLYRRVPIASLFNKTIYRGPADSNNTIHKIIALIRKEGKGVWISEFQAEPWGKAESCTPKAITENTQWMLDFRTDALFFWGFEYWIQEKIKNNLAYWDVARQNITQLV